MPKVKDKGQKRKLNSAVNDAENRPGETLANSQKLPNLEEAIDKSKQLIAKAKNRDSSSSEEPKMCGNTIPMPSLADLEKMFEDSDDEAFTFQNEQRLEFTGNNDVLLSSSCLKTSESKMFNTEQICDAENKDDMKVKPLVIKRKRKIIETNSLLNKDPGLNIDNNEIYCIENGIPTKRMKESEHTSSNLCHNNLSVIIPETSTQNENSEGSGGSNKTVEYDYHIVSPNFKSRSFSPLPSTSKNNEIFLKNDLIFNQSLMSKSDVEIVEMPCETIILDDDDDVICSNVINNVPMPVNTSNNEVINVPDEDDDVIYSTDYMKTFNVDKGADSDCEIIDIDSLIKENKAILDNYKRKSPCFEVNPPVANQVQQIVENEATGNDKTFTEISKVVNSFFSEDLIEHLPYKAKTQADQGVLAKIANLTNTLSSMFTSSLRTLISNPPPATPQSNLDDSVVLVSSHSVQLAQSTMQTPINSHDDQVQIISTPSETPCRVRVSYSNRPIDMSCVHWVKKKSRVKKTEITVPPTRIQPSTHAQANIPIRSIGDCPICMENLSNSTVASTICGHVFCMKCIKAAIQASGKRCPTCRKGLKGNGYHQLFL